MNILEDINLDHIALVTGTPAVPGATPKSPVRKAWIPDGYELIEKTIDIHPNVNDDTITYIPIVKSDEKNRIVWFTPLIPDIPDLQGDIVSQTEIEKARLQFMKNLQFGKTRGVNGLSEDHIDFNKDCGLIVDSFVDFQGTYFEKGGIKGSWVVGIQLSEDSWKDYKKGIIKGVSIGGMGKRTTVKKDYIVSDTVSLLNDLAQRIETYGSYLYNDIVEQIANITAFLDIIRVSGKKADKKKLDEKNNY